MPVLIGSLSARSASQDASTLTTAAFTPTAGELLVLKGFLDEMPDTLGIPTASGGGITWTKRVESSPPGGAYDYSYVVIWTGVVTSGGASITVSMPVGAGVTAAWHGIVVERWAGAKLAGSPATVVAYGLGAPSATLTTTASGSAVSWVSGDESGQDISSRTYRSSAVEESSWQVAGVGYYAAYWARQAAGAAGGQTVGMSAPGSQTWSVAGIEVQDSGDLTGSTEMAVASTGTLQAGRFLSGSSQIIVTSLPPVDAMSLQALADPMAQPPRVRLVVQAPPSIDQQATLTIARTGSDSIQRRVILEAGARLSAGRWEGYDNHAPFNDLLTYQVAFGDQIAGEAVTFGYFDYAPDPNLLPSSLAAMGRAGDLATNGWTTSWGSALAKGAGAQNGAVVVTGAGQYAAISSTLGAASLDPSTPGVAHTLGMQVQDLTGLGGQLRLYIDWVDNSGAVIATDQSAAPQAYPSSGTTILTLTGTRPAAAVGARVAAYFIETATAAPARLAVWGVCLQQGTTVPVIPTPAWVDTPSAQTVLDSQRSWLVHPAQPDLAVAVDAVTEIGDRTSESTHATIWTYAAVYPTVLSEGVRRAPAFELVVRIDQQATLRALQRLLADSGPILVNLAGSADLADAWWDVSWCWVQPGPIGEANRAGVIRYPYRHVTLPCQVVDTPVATAVPDWTVGDLTDLQLTVGQVLERWDTVGNLTLNRPVVA